MRALLLALLLPTSVLAQVLPRWTATQDLRFDADSADKSIRGGVRSIVVDTTGRMYVANQLRSISAYGTDGGLAWTRVGSGIGLRGEEQTIGLRGDTLWVFDAFPPTDQRNRPPRLTLFGADGAVARVTMLPPWWEIRLDKAKLKRPDAMDGVGDHPDRLLGLEGDSIRVMAIGIRDSGNADPSIHYAGDKRSMIDFGGPQGTAILRVRSNGTVASIVARPMINALRPLEFIDRQIVGGNPARSTTSIRPHLPAEWFQQPRAGYSSDGRMFVRADVILAGPEAGRALVTVLRSSGDTAYSRRVPVTVRPIPPELVERELERSLSIAADARLRTAIQKAPWPQVYPPLRDALVSRSGGVLLAFESEGPEREYLVIDSVGTPRAIVRLPSDVTVRRYEDGTLWGDVGNAKGVPSIVRYRVKPPG
jgi:hypothetical protein